MLGRQSSTVLGLLLIVLTVACMPAKTTDDSTVSDYNPEVTAGSSANSSDQTSIVPPAASLTIDGYEQSAGITGYCWQLGDGKRICADGIGFTTPPDPIAADSTFLAQFEFRQDASPGHVQLSIFPASHPVLMGPEEDEWLYWKSLPGDPYTLPPSNHPLIELSKKPGLYVFDVFVEWADYGEVSYGFLVAVGAPVPYQAE